MTVKSAQFEVSVTLDECLRFAQLSGDWNPLHTDTDYAVASVYGRQVLHGAFSAGLISRLAGMYLPGKDCLLYGMKLRFVSPILPPASLMVQGRIVSISDDVGRVEATISNVVTGVVYVDASYEFGYHRMAIPFASPSLTQSCKASTPMILVTGGVGGIGSALLHRLGKLGQVVIRNKKSGRLEKDEILAILAERQIAAIVHCAWPTPDNRPFINLDNPGHSISQHITGPLVDIQFLASLVVQCGIDNAPLILIGSTFANPGHHYFRMPLYSIAKSTIPTVVNILALELASQTRRCFGVVFDMLDGGMNKGISEAARLANADRSPWGELGSTDEAAEQIIWLLENQSKLINGAMLSLSGGSIP